jgi:hypothetical protein
MCWWSQDSVKNTVNTLLIERLVRFQVMKTEFPILINSETDFEEQRFFYPMDSGVRSMQVQLAGCNFISCQG